MSPRSRTVIRQPFQRPCWQLPSEAFFHRTQHDILHCFFVIASGTRCPVNDPPVAAVLREGHTQLFATSQRNSKSSAEHQRRLLSATATRPGGPAYGKVQQVYVQEADLRVLIMRYTRFA